MNVSKIQLKSFQNLGNRIEDFCKLRLGTDELVRLHGEAVEPNVGGTDDGGQV